MYQISIYNNLNFKTMAKKNTTNNEEVKNTVLTFNANIYQLDKSRSNKSFNYLLSGETNNEELKNSIIAKYLSEKIFKVVSAQNNIKQAANKCRFFKLASTKALYFSFSLNGKMLFDSVLFESITIKLQGIDEAKQMQVVLNEVLNIFADTNDTL